MNNIQSCLVAVAAIFLLTSCSYMELNIACQKFRFGFSAAGQVTRSTLRRYFNET